MKFLDDFPFSPGPFVLLLINGPFPLLNGPFSDLKMGRCPECLNGMFSLSKITWKTALS